MEFEKEVSMKVFITKYALTKGILKADATVFCGSIIKTNAPVNHQVFYSKSEWYKTLNGAKQQAEVMRRKKIDDLKKQLDKLQKMSFF